MNNVLAITGTLLLLGAGCASLPLEANLPAETATQTAALPQAIPSEPAKAQPVRSVSALGLPLDRANERISKKPFGLYVTPKDSPVSPERFSGYHVGVDFETFDDEQDRDVVVSAICDGELALKKLSDGYGGVAVQRCLLDNEPITVVYGHLRLESIDAKAGDVLKRGERLGALGKGYGAETDGERKHLHLGVHRGTAITVRGYVQTKAEMGQWLDARLYFPM
ncbi:MAG: M23 family metallopeptidase [Patescibacteria group bacterium]|nr:MAG: M23 family metallopeptidase [Patescibacteria group bacterium]